MRGLSERQKRRLEEMRERLQHGYVPGERARTPRERRLTPGERRARADVRWLMQEWAEDRKSLKNLLKMYYELLCAVVNEDEAAEGPYDPYISGELHEKIVAALRMVGKRQANHGDTETQRTQRQAPRKHQVDSN